MSPGAENDEAEGSDDDRRRQVLWMVGVGILCVAFIGVAVNTFKALTEGNKLTPASQVVPKLPDFTAKLSEEKSLARQLVLAIKQDRDRGAIPPQDLLKGEDHYRKAKAAIDGWHDGIKVVLLDGSFAGSAKGLEVQLKRALTLSREFIDWAEKAHAKAAPPPPGQIGAVVPEVIEALTDAIMKSLTTAAREWRQAQREDRDRLLKALDAVRWENFEKIQ